MLDDMTFDDSVNGEEGLILVNFSAEWCGPCKLMNPILNDISVQENVKIFRVDVDLNPKTINKLGIENIPSVMFFKAGKKVYESLGLKTREEIREKLQELR